MYVRGRPLIIYNTSIGYILCRVHKFGGDPFDHKSIIRSTLTYRVV